MGGGGGSEINNPWSRGGGGHILFLAQYGVSDSVFIKKCLIHFKFLFFRTYKILSLRFI